MDRVGAGVQTLVLVTDLLTRSVNQRLRAAHTPPSNSLTVDELIIRVRIVGAHLVAVTLWSSYSSYVSSPAVERALPGCKRST